jgi:O-antigen/teichoic acid export membrane protein
VAFNFNNNRKLNLFKDLVKVFGFSSIAAVLNLIFAPIILNYTTSTDFYSYSVSLVLASIISLLTTFKVDQIFQLQISFANVKLFFQYCIFINIGVFLIFCWASFAFSENTENTEIFNFSIFLENQFLLSKNYIVLTGALVFLLSLSNLLSGVCFRKRSLIIYGISQIVLQIVFNLCIIIDGNVSSGETLILYQVFAQLFGVLVLIFVDFRLFKPLESYNITPLIIKYKNKLFYPTSEALINHIGGYLPLLLIGFYYGPANAGVYAFVVRILNLPVSFIATNSSRPLINYYKKKLEDFEKKSFEHVSKAFFQVLFLFSPFLFAGTYFFFEVFMSDDNWSDSGLTALLIMPWIFSLLLTAPFNPILYSLGKAKESMFFQMILFFSRIFILFFGGIIFNYFMTILLYSLINAIMWLGYLNYSLNEIYLERNYVKNNFIKLFIRSILRPMQVINNIKYLRNDF